MKTILQHIALFSLLFSAEAFAQDVTTVRANNSDISDNLDLKAVASIFGDSRDLEDFERRLNDPDMQISNLDLNGDNQVDYLRVVEATENNIHLIIIQSVLGPDTFQDIATIEVERDRNNNVQVQVVGDVYMYGSNYMYEPVYVSRPVIYDVFWVNSYRPYYSPWYWGYYPTYYNYWAPYPVYTYRRRVHNHINVRNNYVYVNAPRNNSRAESLYNTRRQNAYERQHPNNSFSSRNNNVSNRYALEQSRRDIRATRNDGNKTRNTFTNSRNNAVRQNGTPGRATQNGFSNSSVRNVDSPARSTNNAVRNNSAQPARTTDYSMPARNNNAIQRSAPVQQQAPVRQNNMSTPAPRQSAPVMRSAPSAAPARQNAPAMRSTPAPAPSRQSAPAPVRAAGGNSRRG